jgi:hypothetical protein
MHAQSKKGKKKAVTKKKPNRLSFKQFAKNLAKAAVVLGVAKIAHSKLRQMYNRYPHERLRHVPRNLPNFGRHTPVDDLDEAMGIFWENRPGLTIGRGGRARAHREAQNERHFREQRATRERQRRFRAQMGHAV